MAAKAILLALAPRAKSLAVEAVAKDPKAPRTVATDPAVRAVDRAVAVGDVRAGDPRRAVRRS